MLCRRLGEEEARTRISNLLNSGYAIVHPDSELVEYAAEYKCRRHLSLADCFLFALARKVATPVLFSRREKELVEEMSKKPFDVDILFLDDVV